MVSLFTDQVPDFPNQNDGTPGINTGTTLTFSEVGFVTHIRFLATTTVGGSDTYRGALWQVIGPDDIGANGNLLGQVEFSSGIVVPGAWNEIALATKIPVVPGLGYRTTMFTGTSGRYVAKPNFFNSGTPLTNGPITAPEHASNPFGYGVFRQGVFRVNSDGSYPNEEFAASCYFVDVVFEAGGRYRGGDMLKFF